MKRELHRFDHWATLVFGVLRSYLNFVFGMPACILLRTSNDMLSISHDQHKLPPPTCYSIPVTLDLMKLLDLLDSQEQLELLEEFDPSEPLVVDENLDPSEPPVVAEP